MPYGTLNETRNALIALAIICLAFGAYQMLNRPEQRPIILSQVQGLADLVTVKYVAEQIVAMEDENILSKDRIVIVAHGVAKSAVNLGKVTGDDIKVTGKTIAIRLPRPQIVDAYIDDKLSRIESRDTGWFIAHRQDLEQQARQKALSNLVSAAKAQGIDREAEVRAKTLIGHFFTALGYEKVEYF